MERNLLSSNRLLLKTILAVTFIALFSYLMVNIIQHGLEKRYVVTSLIFLPPLALATWWAFSAAHPVYFTRDYLYYTRYGKNNRVACEEINEVVVISRVGGKYCQLKFYSNRKKVRSIYFSFASGNAPSHLLLQQLEAIIQRTKPNFEIEGLQ